MPNSFLRQSPLSHLHLEARTASSAALPDVGVHVSEQPQKIQLVVRGQSTDPAFVQGIKKSLGVVLPTAACTSARAKNGLSMLWMGPDEWLVVALTGTATDYNAKLHVALKGLNSAVVDVGESRTIIRLSGECVRTVLNKGCPIDLHPRVFGTGQVVNTILARAHVTIHQIEPEANETGPCFEIYVHRSIAEYLWSWIEDASREFGLTMHG